MSATNTRSPELEAKLRKNARPEYAFLSQIGESYPPSKTSTFLSASPHSIRVTVAFEFKQVASKWDVYGKGYSLHCGTTKPGVSPITDVCFPQSEEWCLGDITFRKLKLLKLVELGISRWDASEESFPLLETLVIKKCDDLEEIPLSFADIPSLKQIKLIGSWKVSMEASAVRIKEEVEEIEGCDRIYLVKEGRSRRD